MGAAHLEMISSEPVMQLAMPFKGPDGQNAGVTVIVARVQALLQKDRPPARKLRQHQAVFDQG